MTERYSSIRGDKLSSGVLIKRVFRFHKILSIFSFPKIIPINNQQLVSTSNDPLVSILNQHRKYLNRVFIKLFILPCFSISLFLNRHSPLITNILNRINSHARTNELVIKTNSGVYKTLCLSGIVIYIYKIIYPILFPVEIIQILPTDGMQVSMHLEYYLIAFICG